MDEGLIFQTILVPIIPDLTLRFQIGGWQQLAFELPICFRFLWGEICNFDLYVLRTCELASIASFDDAVNQTFAIQLTEYISTRPLLLALSDFLEFLFPGFTFG